MKLCIKKIKIFDVQDYFESVPGRRRGSRSLGRLKPYLVRNNLEAAYGIYRKLSSKYKFPIWVNVATVSLFNRSNSLDYSNAYYIYISDKSEVVDFLGVCFITPAKDIIFSLKYRRVAFYLKNTNIAALNKIFLK